MSLKLLLFVFLVLIVAIVLSVTCEKYEKNEKNENVPKLIHLIYIPWDKNQKLKEDYLDFDKTSYEKMKEKYPDYIVKLWTLPDLQQFLQAFYPEYYDIIFNLPRPVMIVDFMRLLLVYHYGGLYWQYGSDATVEMNQFLPSKNKNVKLFTETVLTPEFCEKMKNEPIRNGEPEEPVRVFSAMFSAIPKHPYLRYLFLTAVENSKKYQVKRDYDILYIGSNAMMSTVYDRVGKNWNDIELVDYESTKNMIKIHSNASWRLVKLES